MSHINELAGKIILVTGASGFLGSRTVVTLSKYGCSIRALVRKTSRIDHLNLINVKTFYGDVSKAETLNSVFEGVDYVIHMAADTSGDKKEGKLSTVQGTKNILSLCKQYRVEKLVYISSCNVYGVFDYKRGEVVTEESSLERFPEKRGFYTLAKFNAEQLIIKAMEEDSTPIICLRPATIYGPGGDIYTPMIGFAAGRKLFAVIGDGYFILPLVYIDNMVEAIRVAITNKTSINKIYNVVDPEKVTKKDYMEGLVKNLYPDSRIVYVPFGILKLLVLFQEKLFNALKRPPILTTYRLISSQKPIVYDALKIRNELAWKPLVKAKTAYNNIIGYERGRS